MPEQKKKKLTPEERKKVEKQIADLQAALSEEAEATGAAASAEAAEDVEEQRERLAALFDRLGLTEEDYDLLSGAFAAGAEERTRQIVREELAREEEGGEGGGDDGGLGALEEDPEAGAVAKPEDDKPPPPSAHWTRKRLWGGKSEEGPDA